MEFLLVAGMIVCGWVFLCVLSGERERRVGDLEQELEQQERERARQREESNLRAMLRASSAAAGGHDEKLTRVAAPTRVN
jgi:hypothetical protein